MLDFQKYNIKEKKMKKTKQNKTKSQKIIYIVCFKK